jgi:hypothetical protein
MSFPGLAAGVTGAIRSTVLREQLSLNEGHLSCSRLALQDAWAYSGQRRKTAINRTGFGPPCRNVFILAGGDGG